MKTLYHRLLLVIAGATQKELAKYVRYLKTENQMLRSKLPRRVPVTKKEKAKLVKFGSRLGGALEDLVTIVHPDTLFLDLTNTIVNSSSNSFAGPIPGEGCFARLLENRGAA